MDSAFAPVKAQWEMLCAVSGSDIDSDLREIGQSIKRERIAARLTQRELATRVGMAASSISKLENDKWYPDAGGLSRIIEVLPRVKKPATPEPLIGPRSRKLNKYALGIPGNGFLPIETPNKGGGALD